MSQQPHPIGDPEELAATYLAGAMPPEQLQAYEDHLNRGCTSCMTELSNLRPAVEALCDEIQPLDVDPRVREALLARLDSDAVSPEPPAVNPQVWKHWPSDTASELVIINRENDSVWEPTGIDGVEVRRLFNDPQSNRMTALVRMAPGSSYPAHVHDGPEECFVISGDLRTRGQVLHAGDYERRSPGSDHDIQSTVDGCLLLIVSSLTDKLT